MKVYYYSSSSCLFFFLMALIPASGAAAAPPGTSARTILEQGEEGVLNNERNLTPKSTKAPIAGQSTKAPTTKTSKSASLAPSMQPSSGTILTTLSYLETPGSCNVAGSHICGPAVSAAYRTCFNVVDDFGFSFPSPFVLDSFRFWLGSDEIADLSIVVWGDGGFYFGSPVGGPTATQSVPDYVVGENVVTLDPPIAVNTVGTFCVGLFTSATGPSGVFPYESSTTTSHDFECGGTVSSGFPSGTTGENQALCMEAMVYSAE